MRSGLVKPTAWAAAVSILVAILYFSLYRPWSLYWGATREEIDAVMPGDEIVLRPVFSATRAITVDAPPADIWPWIIQMGYGRAGFYSYDRLDNDGVPSADRIIPEYQGLEAGDLIPMSRGSYAEVILLKPQELMVLRFQSDTAATWAWALRATPDGRTRLITRLRVATLWASTKFLLDTFEIVMMRKCMLGIKRRAESMRSTAAP